MMNIAQAMYSKPLKPKYVKVIVSDSGPWLETYRDLFPDSSVIEL